LFEGSRWKRQLKATLMSWLLPLHVMAEIGGLSVALTMTEATRTDVVGKKHSAWLLELTGITGSRCSLTWSCIRTWRGAKVVSEYHYNHQQIGEPLGIHDFRLSIDGYYNLLETRQKPAAVCDPHPDHRWLSEPPAGSRFKLERARERSRP
jgi:hypothetical protein